MENDFIDVKNKNNNVNTRLKKELDLFDQKCTKERKPFCYRCAKIAYEDKLSNIIKEAVRKVGDIKPSDLELPKINLNDFVGTKCFDELKVSEAWDKVKGTGVEKHIGYNIDYRCKIRGCGRTVFMPKEEYDKLNNKEK